MSRVDYAASDPVLRWRKDEAETARAAFDVAEARAARYLKTARARMNRTLEAITADRLRCRRDCGYYDPAFHRQVLEQLGETYVRKS